MKREMKSAVSLTVIVCVVASVRPVNAQQPAAPPVTVCPLTRAITREAARLPAAGEPTAGEVVQQTSKPVESNWSRVRRLASGREIVVTVKGSPPAQRHFVAAAEADLTLLNLTDPALPAAARDVLRDMAANHPGFFPVADKQSFVNGTVRVAPDGVFVTDRKVADLGQIVEHIPRTDVAEIKALSKSPQHWRSWLGGIAAGRREAWSARASRKRRAAQIRAAAGAWCTAAWAELCLEQHSGGAPTAQPRTA
jgi:hypothetical protein